MADRMTTKEREEVISILSAEGVPLNLTRALLRAGATLHRLAVMECSDQAADRDRVPCPMRGKVTATCLCRDYGSYDDSDPNALPSRRHGTVPRIAVQGERVQRRVQQLCKDAGLAPVFGGDPRGAVLLVTVPSGRTNDWGRRGIVVG